MRLKLHYGAGVFETPAPYPFMSETSLRDRFGIVQWFHYENYSQVEGTIRVLSDLGVRHLRTGISWADYYRPGGRKWTGWMMDALRESDLEILNCIYFTPPSLSMDPARQSCAVPPRDDQALAHFVDTVITDYGDAFHALELWNEPNSPLTWDSAYDPEHRHLIRTLGQAAFWARERGVRTVFGGIAHPDYPFVDRMRESGLLDCFDVFAAHAFPEMWEPYATGWEIEHAWHGWPHRIRTVAEHAGGMPVWVTEAGLATYDKSQGAMCRYEMQVEHLHDAFASGAERFYWYCLFDLNPAEIALEEANGAKREEAEYHLGLLRYSPDYRASGLEKPAYFALQAALRDRAEGPPAPSRGARKSA